MLDPPAATEGKPGASLFFFLSGPAPPPPTSTLPTPFRGSYDHWLPDPHPSSGRNRITERQCERLFKGSSIQHPPPPPQYMMTTDMGA